MSNIFSLSHHRDIFSPRQQLRYDLLKERHPLLPHETLELFSLTIQETGIKIGLRMERRGSTSTRLYKSRGEKKGGKSLESCAKWKWKSLSLFLRLRVLENSLKASGKGVGVAIKGVNRGRTDSYFIAPARYHKRRWQCRIWSSVI